VQWPELERWLIGHTHKLSERGESIPRLRAEPAVVRRLAMSFVYFNLWRDFGCQGFHYKKTS